MSDSNATAREDLERIRQICRRFPEAEERALQDRPLFHVRRRRFAIYNGPDAPERKRWADCGRSLHFATRPDRRQGLEADDRFETSPHHGFRGWMAADLTQGTVGWAELDTLLEEAYRQVAGKALNAELDQVLGHDG